MGIETEKPGDCCGPEGEESWGAKETESMGCGFIANNEF